MERCSEQRVPDRPINRMIGFRNATTSTRAVVENIVRHRDNSLHCQSNKGVQEKNTHAGLSFRQKITGCTANQTKACRKKNSCGPLSLHRYISLAITKGRGRPSPVFEYLLKQNSGCLHSTDFFGGWVLYEKYLTCQNSIPMTETPKELGDLFAAKVRKVMKTQRGF